MGMTWAEEVYEKQKLRFHDPEVVLEVALKAMRDVKFEKKRQKTFFDEVPEDAGWSYLQGLMFDEPRDKMYDQILSKYKTDKAKRAL